MTDSMKPYPDLLATSDQYTLQGYTGQFTICSYRGGLVEVISKDTGEISLHGKESFVRIPVTDNQEESKNVP